MMPPLSKLRTNLLRLAYAIIAIGLGVTLWPALIDPAQVWPLKNGVVASMLGAMSLLAVIGLFRPIEMLPVLMFEVTWKMIWLIRMALPLWLGGTMDAPTSETLFECLPIVPFMLLVPWDHVWRLYFARRQLAS